MLKSRYFQKIHLGQNKNIKNGDAGSESGMTARDCTDSTKTIKPRPTCFGKGCERQATGTDRSWTRERGEDGVPSCNRAERYKQERAPRAFAQGARESSGDLLSRARGPGTIGDLRLNFRVRDGNGCDPHSITAETKSCMESELF